MRTVHRPRTRRRGGVGGSAKWHHKEPRMCLFGNLPFFLLLPSPLRSKLSCGEILSYFRRRSRRIYALSRSWLGEARGKKGKRQRRRVTVPEVTSAKGMARERTAIAKRGEEGGRVEGKSGRITMQLFSFQFVNGF